MEQKTLDRIHQAYVDACENPDTHNIIDILVELYDNLLSYTPNSNDQKDFDIFLRNIERAINTRKKTFEITNLVSDVLFCMMYITIWANDVYNLNLDLNLIARRKSLESELVKLLEKDQVHDRFGVRTILLNQFSEDINTQKLRAFSEYCINIFTSRNRKDLTDFTKWVMTNPNINDYTKERIHYILNIPFSFKRYKDYIKNPKPNGYQSIHYCLVVDMYSDWLPGAEIECQFRTNAMHQAAVNSPKQSHQNYKNEILMAHRAVFTIEDFSKVNIVGFTSYNSVDDDIDGIHWYKKIFNRRISKTLVL